MLAVLAMLALPAQAWAQADPTVVDPNLAVRTVATGLSQPTGLAFIGANDMLVNEKATGRVIRIRNGVVEGPVLDLAVNSNSERGLLGIALHRNFLVNGFVYLFWSESNTGEDSTSSTAVDLMANRVDRFVWNGSTLTFDRNLIHFRTFQQDAGQTPRGNHNGGVVRFGPDGKVYVIVGDTGRRGQMQNLEFGPFGPGVPDDQFGGPEPDDAHFTGVIVRLNDDGTTPTDNPFYDVGAEIGGQAGANIQKIYAYGIRNSYGLNFDPLSGDLWQNENGDDTFSELNRVEPGMNSGWVQIMGPSSRVAQFKEIETSPQFFGLQQLRQQYHGDLFMGGARDFLFSGHIFRMEISGNRRMVGVDDPRIEDRVADNLGKFEATESESLVWGQNFGLTTDILQGPNGNLFVLSNTRGALYEVFRPAK
jgi:glucose/arabinose dehydrogenase